LFSLLVCLTLSQLNIENTTKVAEILEWHELKLCGVRMKSCFMLWHLVTDDISLKYPFFYRPSFEVLENGWDAFQPEQEFGRFKEISEEWRLSNVNKDFSVCWTF
jgi:hypothetical protein